MAAPNRCASSPSSSRTTVTSRDLRGRLPQRGSLPPVRDARWLQEDDIGPRTACGRARAIPRARRGWPACTNTEDARKGPGSGRQTPAPACSSPASERTGSPRCRACCRTPRGPTVRPSRRRATRRRRPQARLSASRLQQAWEFESLRRESIYDSRVQHARPVRLRVTCADIRSSLTTSYHQMAMINALPSVSQVCLIVAQSSTVLSS